MANSQQIKQRIRSAGNIAKITKAMEMVSASKMRRAQELALATRPYTTALQHSLATLAQSDPSGELSHPLLRSHDKGIDVAIVISSDKGLSGSLNPTLFKNTIEWYKQHQDAQLIAVGRKAVAFATIVGLPVHAQFTDLPDQISLSETLPVTSLIKEGFLDKKFKTVTIIYMDFISTLVQKVKTTQLLPLPKIPIEEESLTNKQQEKEYLLEPSAQNILAELLPYYLENSVFQAFLEAKASEHSARMVAMKNASENAGELQDELTLEFNKTRQAAVTSELLDITTALMAQE